MKDRTVIGVITEVKRLRNNVDGNPTWELGMRSGASYRTKPGGTVGYEITPDHAGHHAVLSLEHVGGPDGWVVYDLTLNDKASEEEPQVLVVSESTFESWRENDQLQPGYYEIHCNVAHHREKHQNEDGIQYAYSPDGVGCIWYDSRQDMLDGKASE